MFDNYSSVTHPFWTQHTASHSATATTRCPKKFRQMFTMSRVGKNLTFAALQVIRHGIRMQSTSCKPESSNIKITEADGVRTIILNNPANMNSLSLNMMTDLMAGIKKDEDDINLRSIVIRSIHEKVFSAGHDLKELTADLGSEKHKEVFDICTELMQTITKCPVPVIAAVDGLATAAGCQLVGACDLLICTEESSFSTPGARAGIFCSTPSIPLVRNLPTKVAFYMLVTAFAISGKEAYQYGFANKVVPKDQLDAEVKILTDAIKLKSRSVLEIGKKFVYEQIDLDVANAYCLGGQLMVNNLKMKDAQRGIEGFFEKKTPQWTHKHE